MKITERQAQRIKDKINKAGIYGVYRIWSSDLGDVARIELNAEFTPEDLTKIISIIEGETRI